MRIKTKWEFHYFFLLLIFFNVIIVTFIYRNKCISFRPVITWTHLCRYLPQWILPSKGDSIRKTIPCKRISQSKIHLLKSTSETFGHANKHSKVECNLFILIRPRNGFSVSPSDLPNVWAPHLNKTKKDVLCHLTRKKKSWGKNGYITINWYKRWILFKCLIHINKVIIIHRKRSFLHKIIVYH